MTLYIHTERGQGSGSGHPDQPSWLDRRWRWVRQPPTDPAMRTVLLNHALKEYGPCCHWCGRETFRPKKGEGGSGTRPYHRTLEHLTPRGMGGRDTFENTRIACYECNTKRGVQQEWDIWWHRLKAVAPNRLFGTFIKGDEAV